MEGGTATAEDIDSMPNVVAVTAARDKWLFMQRLRFLPRIFACLPHPPSYPPARPPMASPFAFPSDLIRKQCMRAHLNMCTSISLAALFAYSNRHGSRCASRRRAFSVTEGGGMHRHRSCCGLTPPPIHTPPIRSPQPSVAFTLP